MQAGSALFSARKGLTYEYKFMLYKVYVLPCKTPLLLFEDSYGEVFFS